MPTFRTFGEAARRAAEEHAAVIAGWDQEAAWRRSEADVALARWSAIREDPAGAMMAANAALAAAMAAQQ